MNGVKIGKVEQLKNRRIAKTDEDMKDQDQERNCASQDVDRYTSHVVFLMHIARV